MIITDDLLNILEKYKTDELINGYSEIKIMTMPSDNIKAIKIKTIIIAKVRDGNPIVYLTDIGYEDLLQIKLDDKETIVRIEFLED